FSNGDGWLGNSYFSLPYGYAELLGDMVGNEGASNQLISQVNVPNYYILDDGSKVTNSSWNKSTLRLNNTRAQTGAGYNPTYYQWLNMYALNNACNQVLVLIPTIKFSGDTTTKANTLKAWCYWWKGYAYASIGSMYYSGLLIDTYGKTTDHYVVKDSILARSDYYYNQAATLLGSITNTSDYSTILGQLIPAFCQVGNGGVLTPAMWIRNINTMLARNLLLNKLAPFVNGNPSAMISGGSMTAMSSSDWTNVLNLATNGIKQGDYVFTGRASSASGFFTAAGGTVSALATGPNGSTTFKVGERFLQYFKTGDLRMSTNFNSNTKYNADFFTTRYSMISGGTGTSGVYVYGDKTPGAYELFIAGSYEENALMLAEANIRLGNISQGLSYVDAIRTYQGAGISAVSGTVTTLAGALQELVAERRVALAFRGLSYYDIRRWGWTYDISQGGGSYHNTVFGTTLNTNVTINYNFLDYWDVPADESVLNPPGSGSAPVLNPN
ncbi:MAG TPA: RagB/SusD family nutrient uptake outer membrane protein, partial [Puia sp.]|nr:RagB/SusD family nutrient uptake outer membrane protein [Puia sp.]